MQLKITVPRSILALYPSGIRGELINQLLNDRKIPERYLFYGLDRLIKCGIPVKTNLTFDRISKIQDVISRVYRPLAKKLIGVHGNIEWLLPVWKEMRCSKLIFVFSEKTLYPILAFRSLGLLPRVETILVSIGIAERLQILSGSGLRRQRKRLLKELKSLTRIITFSAVEKEILANEFDLLNVSFIPLGVDVDYFRPGTQTQAIDVLSVGADKNRDFRTFILTAKRLPELNFRLLTNAHHAKNLKKIGIPENVSMNLNVPMTEMAEQMSQSKIVFLPLQENTYSGATTCLLQAMATEIPVITNSVGPTRDGYGLVHDENVVFIPINDVEKAVVQVERLIKEGKTRSRIGRNARCLAKEELSLDRMVDSIMSEISYGYQEAFGVDFPCGTRR